MYKRLQENISTKEWYNVQQDAEDAPRNNSFQSSLDELIFSYISIFSSILGVQSCQCFCLIQNIETIALFALSI